MPCIHTASGIITVAGNYKPGDPPPSGYCDWHEWAEVQGKAGLEQVPCGRCGKFKFPQELSEKVDACSPTDRHGRVVKLNTPVCLQCVAKEL